MTNSHSPDTAPCAAAGRLSATDRRKPPRRGPPELYQIVVECAGETQQRDLFDRLRREGLKLRLLVL